MLDPQAAERDRISADRAKGEGAIIAGDLPCRAGLFFKSARLAGVKDCAGLVLSDGRRGKVGGPDLFLSGSARY